MRRRTGGQSIVEMAFVLPVLLILLFGIMEFGYLIFAYTTVSQAARNAAEAGAQLPPYQSWLAYEGQTIPDGLAFESDSCVHGIYEAARTDQTLFTNIANFLTITYPEDSLPTRDTRNLDDRGPIQVTIEYPVTGITPLFSLLGFNDGTFTLRVTQRRSLENLGVDPSKPGGVACAKDVADWHKLNPNP
ncbi:pilus assembly protein [Oscillochloris sp. ZM17-4]|uniref:TadE family protein n=1 Tax=Oscillochloris sp. ZM17-4 TaxID=2866714 RepID=UPI001C733707|nr:TadE family protein [Oscillochloris sp. ZM17-4]MBX0327617.1 pilus assembly protein [Oscillochloris sp. ZM17-4]